MSDGAGGRGFGTGDDGHVIEDTLPCGADQRAVTEVAIFEGVAVFVLLTLAGVLVSRVAAAVHTGVAYRTGVTVATWCLGERGLNACAGGWVAGAQVTGVVTAGVTGDDALAVHIAAAFNACDEPIAEVVVIEDHTIGVVATCAVGRGDTRAGAIDALVFGGAGVPVVTYKGVAVKDASACIRITAVVCAGVAIFARDAFTAAALSVDAYLFLGADIAILTGRVVLLVSDHACP